jgi:hypothetical protein
VVAGSRQRRHGGHEVAPRVGRARRYTPRHVNRLQIFKFGGTSMGSAEALRLAFAASARAPHPRGGGLGL